MMSEGEIQAEKRYREQERIGISCGAGIPSPDVLELAKREADEWESQYREIFRIHDTQTDLFAHE